MTSATVFAVPTTTVWILASVVLLGLPSWTVSFSIYTTTARRRIPGTHDASCLAVPHRPTTTTTTALSAALTAGDRVLVVGGTGGVGQLVTQKLQQQSGCEVRVTARDKQRGQETIANDAVDVVEVDVVQESVQDIQTKACQGVSGMVISVGTTAFPTAKWKNGNTPDAIDHLAVAKLVQAAAATPTMKRVLLVTSIGVERTSDFPFVILNLFGVLDAKRKGEEALQAAALDPSNNLDCVIVRPGRLVGGPFTNLDIPKLLQVQGGAENGVQCAPGDVLVGDCKRDACAEAIVQALLQVPTAANLEFCIVSDDTRAALTKQEWEETFQSLQS